VCGSQARGLDVSGDALVHADATRALGYTGKGATVALLDTGIDDLSPGSSSCRTSAPEICEQQRARLSRFLTESLGGS